MKIGLLGYGKMGKAIEAVAMEQQLEIVFRITRANAGDMTPEILRTADVVIEFTRPESAFGHVMACLQAGVPVVSGTTGCLDNLPEAEAFCRAQHGALLWTSNFSIGVNLFFALNRYLSGLMDGRPEYQPALTEIHHIHKLDAPSGTALTLVKDILARLEGKNGWTLSPTPPGPKDIPIHAIREGEVPGTHIVTWTSGVDEIRLEHTAHSRLGFAAGAVLAARWIAGKEGVFTMNEVLGI